MYIFQNIIIIFNSMVEKSLPKVGYIFFRYYYTFERAIVSKIYTYTFEWMYNFGSFAVLIKTFIVSSNWCNILTFYKFYKAVVIFF